MMFKNKKQIFFMMCLLLGGIIASGLGSHGWARLRKETRWHVTKQELRDFAHLLVDSNRGDEKRFFISRAEFLAHPDAREFISKFMYLPLPVSDAEWSDQKRYSQHFVAWSYEKSPDGKRTFLLSNLSIVEARDSDVDWVGQRLRRNL